MISQKTLYGWVSICMGISLAANIWNYVEGFAVMNLASKISVFFGSLMFQLLIGAMFYFMWKITPQVEVQTVVENTELDKLLDDLSKRDKEVIA